MVFSSIGFMFLFLPILWGAYLLCPTVRLQNILLVLGSALFYIWGEGHYIWLILISVACNYAFGLAIGAQQEKNRTAKGVLGLSVTFNLGLLAYYKYLGFAANNLSAVTSKLGLGTLPKPEIHLPLGISFLTFHAISYCVDAYRRTSKEQHDPTNLALYFLLFPHLIAGPIVRYNHISEQLTHRRKDIQQIVNGIERLVLGLAKKVLIANTLGQAADNVFALPSNQLGTAVAWWGAVCYAFQIYYDFSGYSDMAVGLAKMFGFEFPENFNYPYTATTITDFWRRWHMSLSTWFRDYLYIPLGGNRKGSVRTNLNLLTVFFLCGLWHGASWNFIVWGLLQGAFMILERSQWITSKNWRAPKVLAHGYTWLVLLVSWVFFRSADISQALAYLSTMFGHSGTESYKYPLADYTYSSTLLTIFIAVAFCGPWLPRIVRRLSEPAPGIPIYVSAVATGLQIVIGFLLFVLTSMQLASSTYNPFIYYRF